MQRKEIQENDLVTVSTGPYNTASNTYRVYKKVKEECILNHPLAPDCYIIRQDKELNNVQAVLQNATERCLFFAKKNWDALSHGPKADLEALIFYFVIKKDISMKQRSELSNICGKIASVQLQNNVAVACEIIQHNKALLDDFHMTLYNNFEKIINKPVLLKNKVERFTVFNLCGFIMAQLGEDMIHE